MGSTLTRRSNFFNFSLFESYCDINNIVKTDTNMPYELDDKKNLDISPSTSPFDTHNFPTSVNDISTWLDGDKYIITRRSHFFQLLTV